MIDIFQEKTQKIIDNYYLVTYLLESKTNLKDAAWALAIGQSVGNPNYRSEYETDELFENHSCLILENPEVLERSVTGEITIAFPEKNINFKEDGVASLLVQIMGGQCDIDIIKKCVVKDVQFTKSMFDFFKLPYFGLSGMRLLGGIPKNQVIFGGIIKPKVGLSPENHLDLVKKFIDNGCNFIKEDEILCNQSFSPIGKRVELVANYIRNTNSKVFYCASIQADPHKTLEYTKIVYNSGGNGIHVNFHCGMGIYKSIREMNLPILMHFQKSGDKILNYEKHNYSIDELVLFKIAALSGCDTLHVGMIGGYMDNDTIRDYVSAAGLTGSPVFSIAAAMVRPAHACLATRFFATMFLRQD